MLVIDPQNYDKTIMEKKGLFVSLKRYTKIRYKEAFSFCAQVQQIFSTGQKCIMTPARVS